MSGHEYDGFDEDLVEESLRLPRFLHCLLEVTQRGQNDTQTQDMLNLRICEDFSSSNAHKGVATVLAAGMLSFNMIGVRSMLRQQN